MDALKVVAEPTRREILRLVWNEERTAGEIAEHFPLSFGAISHHLGVLREAGLVRARPEGNRRWYTVIPERVAPIAPALEAMWGESLDRLVETAEADGDGS